MVDVRQFAMLVAAWLVVVALMAMGLCMPLFGAEGAGLKPGTTPDAWSYAKQGLKGLPVLDFGDDTSSAVKPTDAEKKEQEQAQTAYNRFRTQLNQRKWGEARAVLDEMIEKHRKAPVTAQAFNSYVSNLASDKNKKHETIEAARELIRTFPHYAWSAYWAIQRATGSRLNFYHQGSSTVPAGKKPRLQISGRNIKQVTFKVYKVDLAEMIAAGQSLQAPTVPEEAKPLTSWTVEPQSNRRSRWFNQHVDIPVTEPGAYLVTLGTEHLEWTTMVFVSRLALATKCDGRVLLAYAGESDGGKAAGPCEVTVLENRKVIHRSATSANGLFAGQIKGKPQGALVMVRRGEDVAVSRISVYSPYGYRGGRGQVYVYSDRPVYRPEQTAHFKAILRRFDFDANTFTFEPGETLDVTVRDSKWNEVMKKKVKVNEFGSMAFDFTLGDEPPLGNYQVQINGQNAYGYYSFSVQEYKKPEYEVSVGFNKEHAVIGDRIEVKVGARYYFGEKVKDAKVTYEVYASPRWYYYPICCKGGYRGMAWFAEEMLVGWRPRYYGGQHLIHRGEGRIDADGGLTFAVDTSRINDIDKKNRRPGYYGNTMTYDLRVRAVVTDRGRRGITGHGSVPVGRSGVQLRLQAERYSYRPGENVTINVQATDLAGNPVSVETQCAIKTRTRGKEYETVKTETIRTDDQGLGRLVFKAENNGYYRVEAASADRAGREARGMAHVWVARRGWRSPYSYAGLDIQTDQDLYQPGDVAQVLITSGHADHPVLTTVEGDYLESWRLDRFSGSLCTFDLDVEKTYAPMANLTALVFAKHSLAQKTKPIVVPPADKWLTATITPDKPQYKPGAKATYTLTLTDHQGKPVQGELSLALVDEAIYAIQKDRAQDVRKFYYGHRRRAIYTQSSYSFRARGLGGGVDQQKQEAAQGEQARGAPLADRALGGRGGAITAAPGAMAFGEAAKAKGGDGGMVQPRVRSTFADSAVWEACLKTDATGKATFSFTMPDNLTTWRAKVVAITTSSLVGQGINKIITRQNLMVRLECPRTFTERDQATITAIVHNYLPDSKRCVVKLTNAGGELIKGAREREIQIASGKDKRVDWLLEIKTYKSIKLAVAALTDTESDAMEKTFPVIPHGLKLVAAQGGAAEEEKAFTIALPQNADPDRATMRVSLAPSLGASMMDGLEYLAGFPYGCVEQTMSRFLPTVYVQQVVDGLELQNDDLQQKLPQYVEQGLQRLYGFQHSDGGWGWWKQDESNHYMSAYVVYGLAQAKKAQYTVSDQAIGRGMRYLDQVLAGKVKSKYGQRRKDQGEDLDTRAYVLYAYSQVRAPNIQYIGDLYEKREALSDYALALLLRTSASLPADKNPVDQNVLIQALEKRAITTGTACRWGGQDEKHAWHWQRNRIQATAQALKAITAVNPKHPLLGKAVSWLVNQRRGNRWNSTKDTATTIFALADYMKASGELNPDYEATLALNGKPIKTFKVKGDALKLKPEVFEFDAKQLKPGENTVAITKKGTGSLYYTCNMDSWTQGDAIPAVSRGMAVKREYLLLVPKADNTGYERQPLQGPVKSGQEIEVRLTINATDQRRYFMLEDYFPSGCEVVEDKSDLPQVYGGRYRYWWGYCSNREARDEKMVFFNSWLGKGTQTFVYTLRAETPGTYAVMPAQGSLMYEPDVRGSSPKVQLVIED